MLVIDVFGPCQLRSLPDVGVVALHARAPMSCLSMSKKHIALVPQLHLASPYLCRCGFAVYALQLIFPPLFIDVAMLAIVIRRLFGVRKQKYLGTQEIIDIS